MASASPPSFLSSSPWRPHDPGPQARPQGRRRGRSPQGPDDGAHVVPQALAGWTAWVKVAVDGRRNQVAEKAPWRQSRQARPYQGTTPRTVWQQSVPQQQQAAGAQLLGGRRGRRGATLGRRPTRGARASLPAAPGVAPSPSEVDAGRGGADWRWWPQPPEVRLRAGSQTGGKAPAPQAAGAGNPVTSSTAQTEGEAKARGASSDTG